MCYTFSVFVLCIFAAGGSYTPHPPGLPPHPPHPPFPLFFLFFFIFRRCHTQRSFTFYYFHYYFHYTFKVVYLPIYLRSATLLFPFCVVIRFSVKTRLERK